MAGAVGVTLGFLPRLNATMVVALSLGRNLE